MPTPPGFADVSIELTHALSTRSAFITFGIDPTLTDPSLVAADVLNAARATGSLTKHLDSQVVLTSIRVSMGTDGGGDIVFVGQYAEACSGVASALALPMAILVHKTTARGGRRGRGRMYIPWFSNSSNVSETGVVTPSEVTACNTIVETFRTSLAAGGNPMVLLHGEGRTPLGAPDVVTKLTCDGIVGTQRRRLGR